MSLPLLWLQLKANWSTIAIVLMGVSYLARLYVKLTPNPSDDAWLASFLQGVRTFFKHVGLVIPDPVPLPMAEPSGNRLVTVEDPGGTKRVIEVDAKGNYVGPGTLALLLCASLLFASGCGSAARAVIVGPNAAKPGEQIALDGSQSRGDSFAWECDADCRIVAFPATKQALVTLGQQPGLHTVTLTAESYSTGEKTVSKALHTITVGGTPTPGPTPIPPTPNPGPQPAPPNPQPLPTPPAGKYGLAKIARDALGQVTSPSRSSEAATLRGALRGLQSKIAAGGFGTKVEAVSAVSEAVRTSTGGSDSWAGWATTLYVHLTPLVRAATLPDIGTMCAEVADGLEGA